MAEFESRLTPARRDIAALHLKGSVEAQRFVEGRMLAVAAAITALRAAPRTSSRLETQLLHGERFTVYDVADGWAWGQAALDGYVGYVDARALSVSSYVPTHRVTSRFTQIYEAGDVKAPAHLHLPMNAKLAVMGGGEKFAE